LKSHYIPRALYKLCRPPEGNPIVATPAVVAQTQRQLWKHLLCQECEDRLSKGGESYLLNMIFRGQRFSLLERIRLASPIGQSGNVPMFSGKQLGIKTDSLAYFALSMVWRAAQGPWPTIEGQTTGVSIGQFQEPIRRYLMDVSLWPSKIVVIATVCTDKISQEWVNPPWLIPTDVSGGNFTRIELLVRGIWFWVLMGEVPVQIAEWCCSTSGQQILFMRDCEDQALMMNRHFLETADDRTSTPRLH
jgi:hypothetical protein